MSWETRRLEVDVAPYLDAFETSEHVTVDGYSYLQDNPAPKPSRPAAVRSMGSDTRSNELLYCGYHRYPVRLPRPL